MTSPMFSWSSWSGSHGARSTTVHGDGGQQTVSTKSVQKLQHKQFSFVRQKQLLRHHKTDVSWRDVIILGAYASVVVASL